MSDDLPKASLRPSRWRFPIVWVVPGLAAIAAGYLVYGRLEDLGPTITIGFSDVTGLKAGQTEIRHRGVPVGEVTSLELPKGEDHVVVKARLRRPASHVAREGSVFWIVRPEVGIETIRGLATVITGPYIEVFPGTGPPRTEFVGVDRPSPTLGRKGLKITLATPQLGSIRPGAPVYYRGIVVGSVTGSDLSSDAATARVHVFIDQPSARLVRAGSRFWSASGVDVNVSLFRGVEINLESLRSLITGGVAFATADADSPPVKDGTVFPLHDKLQKEWLDWAPKIPLRPPG